jgi:hypothetical protein
MDTSIFAFDLPAWLSWGSNILYAASLGLALLVVVLISGMVAQNAADRHNSEGHKRNTHPAH